MKRIVAIFLLVICVTLPLLSWGATDQCPKCGKYDTITTVKTTCIFKLHYTQQEHEMLRKKTIKCRACNETTTKTSRFLDPHIMQTKIVDMNPNLNLKQVKHSCAVCYYNYITYEPIDPSKPYVRP